MTRIISVIALGGLLATFVSAQVKPMPTRAKGETVLHGVVLDASCRAIATATPAKAQPTAVGASTAATPSGARAEGSAPATSSSTTTGVNPEQSGQPAPPPPNRAAVRNRTASDPTGESAPVAPSIPEQYKPCEVKSSTTQFALLSNGRVYKLDDDAEGAVRTKVHVKSPTGWHEVSITGLVKGDRIQVLSVE